MFKILGTDDSVNTCDCCGKSGLKYTVTVEVSGELRHYGSTCATRHTGKSAPEIKREIETARRAKIDAARRALHTSPEYLALVVKRKEGFRLNVAPGRQFKEFARAESEACDRKLREIAEQFGVTVSQII